MTAKDYLNRYKEACRRARQLRSEYEKELELIDSVRSTLGGDGMPHGNGVNKSVEDKAIRLAEKALDWKTAELDAIQVRQEIFETIFKIGGIESEVLCERYVNLHKWEEVCVLVHLSWKQTHRIHARALEAVSNLINDIE